ncbi:unknown protein [Seminavis robusta]|uniref:Uncharacterized protein n=1 Tax=Seminavis robusta TaxID=568900 RepID=A0A9N8EN63_9STRA|nr:unknown protein [Seminavis robusta]|eukprot:Sro1505_g278240.1 n/a (278) ;mRNA; r:25460-26369
MSAPISKTPKSKKKAPTPKGKKTPVATKKAGNKKPSPIPEDRPSSFTQPPEAQPPEAITTFHNPATGPIVFKANVNLPERNGPFTVLDVGQTVEGCGDKKGRMFYGYFIFFKFDVRFNINTPLKPLYKGRLLTTDTVQLTVPAWDYSLLKCRDSFVANSKLQDNFTEAIDDVHDKFANDEENRFFCTYHMQFEGYKLSSKAVYPDAGEDELVGMDVIKVEWVHAKSKSNGTDFFARWIVVRTDKDSRKKGKREEEAKKLDAVAQQLKELGLEGLDGN